MEYIWAEKDILPQDLADLLPEDDSDLDMAEYNISEDVIVEDDEEEVDVEGEEE